MLKEISNVENIPACIEKVNEKYLGVELVGFGYRVYHNFYPCAKLMRKTWLEVVEELGLQKDLLFKLAMVPKCIAPGDEYCVSRKLYPNVDVYSATARSALVIPVSPFTGVFAWARTIGWIA